jgi:hypothetical protein
MLEFSDRIASEEFAQLARHPDSLNAFTRGRKLPLPALIASLLSMRGLSQQVMIDTFFDSVCAADGLHRGISDRAGGSQGDAEQGDMTGGFAAASSGARMSLKGRALPVMFPIELPGSGRIEARYSSRATPQITVRCTG